MPSKNAILVLDAGNTAIKTGLFNNGELSEVKRFTFHELQEIQKYTEANEISSIAVSSVLKNDQNALIDRSLNNVHFINHQSRHPIQNHYETPLTLGMDRLCNVVAAYEINPTGNNLVIDIGTCIKFDFIRKGGIYEGGSISPGVRLRYKSLNDYTANLPLVDDFTSSNLIGRSTLQSIHSGVINGVKNEIKGMMELYNRHFSDLTFFMTGGDSEYFDFEGKNNIFVDENLTLKGIYHIYQFHVKNI